MKATQKLLTIFTILCVTLNVMPIEVARAKAQPLPETTQGKVHIPETLQEAILSAGAEPFTQSEADFTTQHNGLDFRLNKAGLQASSSGLRWGIKLSGFGRGEDPSEVSPAEIVQTGSRLEYRRGALTEWYRDTLVGVEQGFTIAEPPKGNGRLVLQLDLDSDLPGSLDGNGHGISFEGPEGTTLRYDGLKATDAEGNDLEARFIYTPTQVVIQVSDRGAAYPVTIDPFIYLEQKVIASDGAEGDWFGYSVALYKDTALVGTNGSDVNGNSGQGSAYVFTRSGTSWSQQAKLTASDGAAYDSFGTSVALDGDTALVGAYTDTVGANSNQGSAYVFVRSGTSWSQQKKLTASDGAADDHFGYSVALSGETALVGTYTDTVGANPSQGSAYVFVRSGTNWSQQTRLTAADGAASDYFGYSVALSGNTALVGAIFDDINANNDQGSAYVFTRSGTSWSQQKKLTSQDGAAYDAFGYSVALYGNTALVGTPYDDVGANNDQGSAYVFTRSGSIWHQGAKLTASDEVVGVMFGQSVTLYGDTVLVGSYFDNIGGNSGQGSAYFYQPYTDVSLSAAFNAASAHPGDTVYLTLSATNFGPTYSAFNLSAKAPLPAGLPYGASAATHGTYNPTSGTWKIGMLPSGASATLTITATVDTLPKTLTFSASLVGSDLNPANNQASASLKVIPYTTIFRSKGAQDGWVLESGELTNKGGTLNTGATTLRLGDNFQKKQYRTILSFATKGLPNNAVITRVTLKVKRQSVTPAGSNPPAIFQGFMADMRKGFFGGGPGLALNDFQVVYASRYKTYGPFQPALVNGWYSLNLTNGRGFINKFATNGGVTQVRLRFSLDDNNNTVNDYLSLFSGNAVLAKRPRLIVQYYVP